MTGGRGQGWCGIAGCLGWLAGWWHGGMWSRRHVVRAIGFDYYYYCYYCYYYYHYYYYYY